jgi:hypothetical protein
VFDASESFLQTAFLDCIQDPVIHGSLLGMQSGGGLAEYALAHISTTAKRPFGVTAMEGACLGDAAFSALQSVRDWAGVPLNGRKPQWKVPPNILITDASGAVGTFAVQVSLSLSLSLSLCLSLAIWDVESIQEPNTRSPSSSETIKSSSIFGTH